MSMENYLLPLPKSITEYEGCFVLNSNTRLILEEGCNDTDYHTAKLLKHRIYKLTYFDLDIIKGKTGSYNCICFRKERPENNEEGYNLKVTDSCIILSSSSSKGLLNSMATLLQLIAVNVPYVQSIEIMDSPDYMVRGYMLDTARGRVPTLEYLKDFIDTLALYKINQLQLYVESCIKIPGLEEIYSQADYLEPDELIDLDNYCQLRGIELVPCIATFGHLYDMLRSAKYCHLSEMDTAIGEPQTWFHRMRYHILNVSDDNGFETITQILDRYLPLFKSHKVNICCDETFDLGKGKSAELAKKKGYGEMYFSYVNLLAEYLQRQGKEVMIWGDIAQNHKDCLDGLDKDIVCLNWYYYYNVKEENIKVFKDFSLKQYVCPSVSGFSRLVNAYDMSFSNIKEMATMGRRYEAIGFVNTDWGDSGHVNMPLLAYPAMIYGGCVSWNTEDDRSFENIDEAISLIEYNDKAKKIVSILRELSRQDKIIFNEIAFFHDYKIYNLIYDTLGTCLYDNARKKLMDISEEELICAAQKSNAIADQLVRYAAQLGEKNMEFYLAAKGVSLMHYLVLIIKKYEYLQKVEVIHTPNELADQIMYWLSDYCNAWRRNSKETELFRVKQFFVNICKILHSYNNQ